MLEVVPPETNDTSVYCAHVHPCSYVWGAVADRKGRKPVIIASCLLLGLSSAAFGFSVHFAMAVVFRFGVGLMNGEEGMFQLMFCTAGQFPCLCVSVFHCLFSI